MGVSGLWEIINKSRQTRSVAHLAVVDGFEANKHGTRTLRVGIDASLWLQHVSTAKWLSTKKNPNASSAQGARNVGVNPELRTLFFRLAQWSKLPVSLLFVFDGRGRPLEKRGSKMGKSGSHELAPKFKELIKLFGMDWREAKGEAEAELAFLNQVGAIDAVVTDDIDCLIFGAQTVIKNFGLDLSGNKGNPPKNADGNTSKAHAHVYTADDIRRHPDVRLTRDGLILFALMSGGDYDTGIFRCGPAMAHAMARSGFGEQLVQAYERYGESGHFTIWLEQWRTELQAAIRANSHGLMARGAPNFVIPQEWPKVKTLQLYVEPVTSASNGGNCGGPPRDREPLDLPGLAWFCEKHFEDWGYKSAILKRFGSLLTQSLVMRVLRAAALEADSREKDRRIAQGLPTGEASVRGPLRPRPYEAVGTSATLVKMTLAPKARGGGYAAQRNIDLEALRSAFARPDTPEPDDRGPDAGVEYVEDTHPLIVGITGRREHVSTDKLSELRVKVCREQLVAIAGSGIKGLHDEPGPRKRWIAYTEDEPDEGDEEDEDEGEDGRKKKKRGKQTDPRDDMLLWIPETIMRQVHPALVEEWENNRNRGGRARGSNMSGNTASRNRAAAAPRPQPGAPQAVAPQAYRPVAPPAADPVPMLHVAAAAAPSVQPPAPQPAPKRAGRGKGKARAASHNDYDYLAINPYASSAPPQHDFNPMVDTSLPFRRCGFMFTWPDPDDPDQLIVDTDERDDLPTEVNYREIGNASVFGEYDRLSAVSRSAPRTQARTRVSTTPSARSAPSQAQQSAPSLFAHEAPILTSAAASASGVPANQPEPRIRGTTPKKRKQNERQAGEGDVYDDPWVVPQDYGRNRFSQHAQEINRYLGIGPDGEPVPIPKGSKKTRGRIPSALAASLTPMSASASARDSRRRAEKGKGKERAYRDPSPFSSPMQAKRRKTGHKGAVQDTRSFFDEPGPSNSGFTSTSRGQVDPLFLESDSSRSPSPLNVWPRSSPAPPPSSSAFTTPSTSRSDRVGIPPSVPASPCPAKRPIADDIISISSDSGDDTNAGGRRSPDDWLRDLNSAPFNGAPSFYSQRKARESQRSLNTALDIDPETQNVGDAMDLDPEPSALSSPTRNSKPKLSEFGYYSASASSRRSYRDPPMPSSSQENALNDDIFRT
ncbi:hypothetical protein DICSQDRAFT_162059 [Dichomitus squalens LYAD-421 SS1]|uniref:XPG-I domain-containing protein n=1 Tax=Dichomitus squalens (strain LYAD-421) TaxID=732165 RepID=R7SWA6_DICSQ|nr:uncharacterized protein DICSQDRAFT_162059 [Dichomitus squalens LYAD-421 SS1]EJF60479.1 hypothetical protein DICSQDRAFT_162059 [Dichomitus squalens LYAD-421 SS1]